VFFQPTNSPPSSNRSAFNAEHEGKEVITHCADRTVGIDGGALVQDFDGDFCGADDDNGLTEDSCAADVA
jgi:hypothetical protein